MKNSRIILKQTQYLGYASSVSRFLIYKVNGFFYPSSSNLAQKMFLNTAQWPSGNLHKNARMTSH